MTINQNSAKPFNINLLISGFALVLKVIHYFFSITLGYDDVFIKF